jgi:ATP-binding cassette, subfamily B, bacterial
MLGFFSRKKPTETAPTFTKTTGAPLDILLPKFDQESDEEKYKKIDFALLRRMAGEYRPFWKLYASGITLGVVVVFIMMLGPWFIQQIIKALEVHIATKQTAIGPTMWTIVLIILAWLGATILTVLIDRVRILIMTGAGERVQFSLRKRMFSHLQMLSMSFYDKTKLGRIISRCTSDIGSMREVNVWGIDLVLLNVTMIIVAGAMMAYLTDWRLFLAVAWLAPVLFVLNRIYLKKVGVQWQVVREGFTRVSTNLAENITGVRVVTAFDRQDPNLRTFNALQEFNTTNNLRIARINGVYQPALAVVGLTGKAVILLYGGYLVASGKLKGEDGSVGVNAVVAAFLYWDWFMNPILTLGGFYNTLMQALAGAERVFGLLDTKPEVVDQDNAITMPPIQGRVTFDHVTFGYVQDRMVLHDISFDVLPGQTVALVGHTGSGKSSIISLIARFYQPQKGSVLVDGIDIRSVKGETLHQQMGLVLQHNYLFTGSVMENIKYGHDNATDDDVINAAKSLGTHDAITQLKDGYATTVGERGASLSLGQRQLICFTRAFLTNPRIFMLDEATSAIDTQTEMLLQESLGRLTKGRTTFVVAHRLSTIMNADLILVIDKGVIMERGTHDQLLALGGKYAHLYEQFVGGVLSEDTL